MPIKELTKSDWNSWREHPVTEVFFEVVKELREESLQMLANGMFSEEQGKQNILVGKINALTKVLETTFGDE